MWYGSGVCRQALEREARGGKIKAQVLVPARPFLSKVMEILSLRYSPSSHACLSLSGPAFEEVRCLPED